MDFEIRPHTILLTRAGSRAYGTNTESSDLDLKGVAIPPKLYYLGCQKNFEQADSPEHARKFLDLVAPHEAQLKVEGSIYELKKCMGLLTQANPNLWELLFCRDQDVLLATKLGEKLRTHRDAFLSRRARFTAAGYAHSQLGRIKLHRRYILSPPKCEPTRADFDLPEAIPKAKYDVAFDSIQKHIDGWELDLTGLDPSTRIDVVNHIANRFAEIEVTSDQQWKCAGRAIGLDEDLLSVLERERKFRTAQSEWKSYLNWKKNRNPERAALEEKFLMDTKHASHLVRLMRMCREIMTTGKVNVWRGDIDAEELLEIRNGSWSYEKVMEFADAEDAALTEIYNKKDQPLPKVPDINAIDALCQEILEEALWSPST